MEHEDDSRPMVSWMYPVAADAGDAHDGVEEPGTPWARQVSLDERRPPMMSGWDNGLGTGGWVLMILAWLALLGLVVWAISRLLPTRPGGDSPEHTAETPEEILDRRLARGEIDTDEYTRLREALTAQHDRKG
jgi:putative membrane protein